MRVSRCLVTTFMLACMVSGGACGKAATTPDSPETPAPNHSPVITSMTVTPQAVLGVTAAQMSATAADADNDALTYQWSFAGGTASGAATSAIMNTAGNVVVTLTVSDGHSGTATDTRTVVVVTLTGTWQITSERCGNSPEQPGVATLTQTGATVTGPVALSTKWCGGDFPAGTVLNFKGTLDEAGRLWSPIVFNGPDTDYKRIGVDVMLDGALRSGTGRVSYWVFDSLFADYAVTGSSGKIVKQ